MTTERTNFYLQWKGTDACIDFQCECGADGHIDSDFVYYVRCPGCDTLYKMPDTFYPEKATPEEAAMIAKVDGHIHVFDVAPEDVIRVQEIAEERKRSG